MKGPRSLGCLAALTSSMACGGASIEGGHTAAAGAEPRGKLIVRYDRAECRDGKKRHFPTPFEKVELVEASGSEAGGRSSRRVLIEFRRGLDSLVVEPERGEGVFQVRVESEDGDAHVREYRVPKRPGAAELRVSTEDRALVLECSLLPAAD